MNEFEARAAYLECPREIRNAPLTVVGGEGEIAGIGFTGYASTVEDPYPVTDWLGEYTETMCRGAFTKALNDAADVRLLINHQGLPLARTKSGTMQLSEDGIGLNVDVPTLGNSPFVMDVQEAMRRGDLDEMSFSFKATRQEWNKEYTERLVQEVKLYDVSLVTYPANPGTTAKLRSEDIDTDRATTTGSYAGLIVGTPCASCGQATHHKKGCPTLMPTTEHNADEEAALAATARRISLFRHKGRIV